MKYTRVLLKLSGEALMGNQQYGIDPGRLNDYAEEIAEASKQAQIAIVIGGGNIFRGLQGASKGTAWRYNLHCKPKVLRQHCCRVSSSTVSPTR